MESRVRWQHWINFLSGGWLFVSPWVLDYLEEPLAAALNAQRLTIVSPTPFAAI